MNTIGGGTVKLVDVALLPCPEQPTHVGQVIGPGRLDILWHGRVVESFPLHTGDELLVADGADVPPGTSLVARDDMKRVLRADIPDGAIAEVRWSEPLVETIDEVTGMTRLGFASARGRASDRPVVVELVVDGVVVMTASMRDPSPSVTSGAVVRRGELVAWFWRPRRTRELVTSVETVRAFLDARKLPDEPVALVAPCDATVIAIDEHAITLQATDGRMLRLRFRQRRRAYAVVEVGDSVVAGEPLTDGERDHHALLHAWGEHRLGEHIIDELSLVFGDSVPRVYWALALRAMIQGGKLRGIASIARARRATDR